MKRTKNDHIRAYRCKVKYECYGIQIIKHGFGGEEVKW